MSAQPVRDTPYRSLLLPPDEVHVWSTSLDQYPSNIGRLEALLSSDECQRAARFHCERDRRLFIVARGRLRTILGTYLHDDSSRIVFRYGRYGKPQLAGQHDGALHFNVSHSHELGVFAFARSWPVGVDVEHMRRMADLDLVASSVLSRDERAAYSSLAPVERPAAFFMAWTRKEAAIKGPGHGFHLSPREIPVSLVMGQRTRLRPLAAVDGDTQGWWVQDLPVPAEYVAALAVPAGVRQIICRRWSEEAHKDGASR